MVSLGGVGYLSQTDNRKNILSDNILTPKKGLIKRISRNLLKKSINNLCKIYLKDVFSNLFTAKTCGVHFLDSCDGKSSCVAFVFKITPLLSH